MSYAVPDNSKFPFCPVCDKPTLVANRDAAKVSDRFVAVHCPACGHQDAMFTGLEAAGYPNDLFVSQTIRL